MGVRLPLGLGPVLGTSRLRFGVSKVERLGLRWVVLCHSDGSGSCDLRPLSLVASSVGPCWAPARNGWDGDALMHWHQERVVSGVGCLGKLAKLSRTGRAMKGEHKSRQSPSRSPARCQATSTGLGWIWDGAKEGKSQLLFGVRGTRRSWAQGGSGCAARIGLNKGCCCSPVAEVLVCLEATC